MPTSGRLFDAPLINELELKVAVLEASDANTDTGISEIDPEDGVGWGG